MKTVMRFVVMSAALLAGNGYAGLADLTGTETATSYDSAAQACGSAKSAASRSLSTNKNILERELSNQEKELSSSDLLVGECSCSQERNSSVSNRWTCVVSWSIKYTEKDKRKCGANEHMEHVLGRCK